ncbi:MAG: hypothetical protein HYY17_07125 [Planctomycetes bacterium]|nr:hypothetical protein [Planctomycetota bacterium]
MTPTCANRDEWLGPFVYHDLPFDAGMAADEHVRSCAACAAEAAKLGGLVAALPPPSPVPARRPFPRWVAAAAAAVLIAAGGFLAGRGIRPHPAAPPIARAPAPPAAPAPDLMSPEVRDFVTHGRGALPESSRRRLDERLRDR